MPWLPQVPAAGESLPQCFLCTSGHALDFMPTWPLSCPPPLLQHILGPCDPQVHRTPMCALMGETPQIGPCALPLPCALHSSLQEQLWNSETEREPGGHSAHK